MTTTRRAAIAVELVVIGAVAHGVIEGDLFARKNIAHGDETGRAVHARVGIAAMVEAIGGIVEERVEEEEVFVYLQDAFGKIGDREIQFGGGDDASAPHDDDLPRGDELAGDDAATAFVMERDRFNFWGKPGKEFFNHSAPCAVKTNRENFPRRAQRIVSSRAPRVERFKR